MANQRRQRQPLNPQVPSSPSPSPAAPGDAAVPQAIVDVLDRLRDAIGRIPGGIAARLQPVVSRVSADLGDKLKAGLGGIGAGLGGAASRLAKGFEKAFDASIGRVISGLGAGLNGAGRAARATWQNPMGAFRNAASATASAAGRARFGGAILGAYALKRARRAFAGARRSFRGFGATVARLGKGGVAAALKRTRLGVASAVAAYRAGTGVGGAVSGFAAGATGVSALGAVGPAVGVILKARDAMQDFAERTNDSNRWLAPYSGKLSAAFGRGELAEERRNLDLARGTENSAAALADSVSNLKDSTTGMSKLWGNIKNRIGREFSDLIQPGTKSVDDFADRLNTWFEEKNPNGKPSKTWSQRLHEGAAWYSGWIDTFARSGGDTEAARRAADDAMREREKAFAAGNAVMNDGWTDFMQGAMAMPALNPPRKFNP